MSILCTGLFSQMLNYVVAHCKTCAASEYEHDYELKVIPEACRFLFACVNGNEVVWYGRVLSHNYDIPLIIIGTNISV